MQSDSQWLRQLATSEFLNGAWITPELPEILRDPFALLTRDLEDAIRTYNTHAEHHIRISDTAGHQGQSVSLLFKSAHVRLSRNGKFVDISLLKTSHFQTSELPITRVTPVADAFGFPIWKRGQLEISTEQLVKGILLHLLESAQSDSHAAKTVKSSNNLHRAQSL